MRAGRIFVLSSELSGGNRPLCSVLRAANSSAHALSVLGNVLSTLLEWLLRQRALSEQRNLRRNPGSRQAYVQMHVQRGLPGPVVRSKDPQLLRLSVERQGSRVGFLRHLGQREEQILRVLRHAAGEARSVDLGSVVQTK